MDTLDLIARHADGGVISRRRLLGLGADPVEISRLRHAGAFTVIRPGWYATSTARPQVVAAVRAFATVTCVSALAFTPVWVPPDRRVHLRWPAHRVARGAPCRAHRPLATPVRAVDPLPLALQCAANCLAPDYLVAVLDSTLRMPRPYSIGDLRQCFDGAPRRVSALLDALDPMAGSGTESIVRFRLRRAHMGVRTQVQIAHVGRVDLLVGDKLIIECDSRAHHNDEQRRADNRRDRAATLGDYRVLRIDYADVMFDWDAVFAEITAIVRTGRHRGRTRFTNSG
ncbi:endonuclease domain-containing protein [Tsukamurella strandjordii]|uniref:endonuclease domain-containing protein n=1 Tax=Tsukamurella TaxID=2060 RepID=UPI001C7DD160|nr:DUF559 domain-containing protein [Tsukamurella sp. TY48]GIZ96574.1 hypothetical protein TTY48_11860 [Tsukamurella sp. TY48]